MRRGGERGERRERGSDKDGGNIKVREEKVNCCL